MAGQTDRDNQEKAAAEYRAAEISNDLNEAIAANALRQSMSETQSKEDDQLYEYFEMILSEGYDPTKFSADFTVVVEIMLSKGLNRESIYTYLEDFAVKNNLDWAKIRNAIELQMEIIKKIQTIETEYHTSVEMALLKAVNALKSMLARGELPGAMSVRAEASSLIEGSRKSQAEFMDKILNEPAPLGELNPRALDNENTPESFTSIIDGLIFELTNDADLTSLFFPLESLINHAEGQTMSHDELIASIKARSEVLGVSWSSIAAKVNRVLSEVEKTRRATQRQQDRTQKTIDKNARQTPSVGK